MRTFLPPEAGELFPELKLDREHLAACRDNLFFRAFLNLVYQKLHNHKDRLSSEKASEEFDFRRGRIAGIDETLQILDTLRTEVEHADENGTEK